MTREEKTMEDSRKAKIMIDCGIHHQSNLVDMGLCICQWR